MAKSLAGRCQCERAFGPNPSGGDRREAWKNRRAVGGIGCLCAGLPICLDRLPWVCLVCSPGILSIWGCDWSLDRGRDRFRHQSTLASAGLRFRCSHETDIFEVLLVKLGLLLIQVAAFVLLIGGFWSRSFPLMMVIGFVMANLHAFAEAGEAVGFLSYRYGLVAWMRVFVGTVMYAAPVGYAFIVGAPSGAEAIHAALRIGSFAGLLVVSGYLWKTYRMLADFPDREGGTSPLGVQRGGWG